MKNAVTKNQTLKVRIEGQVLTCPRSAYVSSKTKQLRAFGYSNLTEEEVDKQVSAVLAGKKLFEGLTVIGKFIEGEVSSV